MADVELVEKLCAEILAQRDKVDSVKLVLKNEQTLLDDLEFRALATLEEIGKDSYKSNVGTITKTHRPTWLIPRSPEAREAFFTFLKEKGVYSDLITVNSQTLNAFCKSEVELAKEKGEYLTIPGLELPNVKVGLSFRRSK